MWLWCLLGYEIIGFIAIFGSVVWFLLDTPVRNGYDLVHWLDHVNEIVDEIIEHQTYMDNVLGVIITIFIWPVKLAWVIREVYPRIIELYEELLVS